jgi:gliding motility-associated-like protein
VRKLAVLGLGLILWAQSLPESDCINAIPVCQQTYTYTNSPPDFGQTQELTNNTCLLNNEQKTVWFIFTVQQSGTFGFTVNTSYDYDFALWDITNSSCAIVGNTAPIRCNFSADNGATGLDANNPQAGSLSWDASQPPIMPGLNVTAGQTFVLLLDNYTRDQTGFTITFSGTAQIFDNTPPTLVSARQDCNRTNRIILRFSEPVSCSTVAANGSDFSISGGLNVVAAGCMGGGLFSYEVWIEVGGTLSSGTYTITIQSGSDGNTVADKCGNFAAAGQSVQVSVLGSLSMTVTPREICVNDPGGVQLQGSVAGGLPPGAVASWSTGATGLTAQAFPSSTAPYFEEPYWEYYTLTVTLGNCTYSLVDSVRVHPLPRAELVPAVVYTCGGRPVELTGLASILGGTWEKLLPSGSWQGLPAPVVLEPGVHQVRCQTPAGCVSETLTVQVVDAPLTQGACNVLHVTPTGSPTGAGTPDDPLSLEAALTRLQCRKGLIKLAQGTYLLTRPITTVTDSIILEGGYDPAAGWVKRSTPGLTVLRRTATNVEGCQTLSPRLTAFQIHGAKAFRLQDFTIAVENAPAASAACADGRGISTYGLYLRDCAGYETVTLFSSEAFALAYEWTVTQNGQPVPFQTNRDTVRFIAAQVGRYTIRLRVQTLCCGWVGPVEKEITVIEAPVIRATGAAGCFPLLLQAELVSGVAGGTFVWYDSRGDSVGTGAQLILPGPVADSTYSVEYRVGSCGSSRVSVSVQGVPTPVLTGVSATPPLQPAPEGPVNIDFTALYQAPANSPVNFTWFFGDGGQYSSSQPQAAHLYSPGVYTLTLIAAIGDCRDTLTLTVEVLGSRQLIIPNVFTPNGDGINDVWIPVGAGIRRMDIRIYDRWGKILYQGAGPWRGEEAIEGVYTYVVDVEFLDGSRVNRAGTVTLLR